MSYVHFQLGGKDYNFEISLVDGQHYKLVIGQSESFRDKIPQTFGVAGDSLEKLKQKLVSIGAQNIYIPSADELTKAVQMDIYLQDMCRTQDFRGAVLVRHNDKRLLYKGYGSKNLQEQNTPHERFCIGSMGKMMTASAIMQLNQEGKLSLDDPINQHLPQEFRNALFEKITIRHLLTHTSGLPTYGSMAEDEQRSRVFNAEDIYKLTLVMCFIDKNFRVNGEIDMDGEINSKLPPEYRQERWSGILVHDILVHETGLQNQDEKYQKTEELYNFMVTHVRDIGGTLLFEPGERWKYSNSGYVLLGQIIKNVSHEESYEAYMQKHIFERFHMDKTGFASSYDEEKNAKGFYREKRGGELFLARSMQIHASKANAAGGSIFSALDDMEKWDLALYDDTFLSPETREKMFTPCPQSKDPQYGLGFGITGDSVVHPGANHGFNSMMNRNLKTHDLVIILSNIDLESVDEHAGKITEHLFEILNEIH